MDRALGEDNLVEIDHLQLHVLCLLQSIKSLSPLFINFVPVSRWSGLVESDLLFLHSVLLEDPFHGNWGDQFTWEADLEESALFLQG